MSTEITDGEIADESSRRSGAKGSGAHLQSSILTLSRFWMDQGCLWLPPCDFEVPGATLHPDVFFGVLKGLPFRSAYFQPVRRPLDGRQGRHPYRLAKHLQFQVMLTPPPDDVRPLYLASLRELGLDPTRHDVRFVEWNWKSRTLAASGRGWYVRLDGLGVTRITYLQELGGRELDTVALELNYGLERLLMILAGARSTFQLHWSDGGPDYGSLRRDDEEQLTRYAFEVADVDLLRRNLDDLEREARRCLDAGLLRLAYELAVKSLQSLDLLEARGELLDGERLSRVTRLSEVISAVAERDRAARQPAPGPAKATVAEAVAKAGVAAEPEAPAEPSAEKAAKKQAKEQAKLRSKESKAEAKRARKAKSPKVASADGGESGDV